MIDAYYQFDVFASACIFLGIHILNKIFNLSYCLMHDKLALYFPLCVKDSVYVLGYHVLIIIRKLLLWNGNYSFSKGFTCSTFHFFKMCQTLISMYTLNKFTVNISQLFTLNHSLLYDCNYIFWYKIGLRPASA